MGAFLLWDSGSSFFSLDVVTTETHEFSSMVTEHPVEEGANVTDHVRPNLNKVTLEGFVSNTPLGGANFSSQQVVLQAPVWKKGLPAGGNMQAIRTPFGTIELGSSHAGQPGFASQTIVTANVIGSPVVNDFVAQALTVLQGLQKTATLVDIATANTYYTDMLIDGIDMSRAPDDGTGATFKISLREIRTVKTSLVKAPIPAIPRAIPKVAKGAQAPVETSALAKSAALKLTQAVFGQ